MAHSVGWVASLCVGRKKGGNMRLLIACFMTVLSCATLAAQMPTSYNIGGAGARAMGMGGAFSAIADDATAVYFNPGGLAQLKRPEVTAVGYYSWQQNTSEFNRGTGAAPESGMGNFNLNFASLVLPLNPGGRNIIVAGSGHLMIDSYLGGSFSETGFPGPTGKIGADASEQEQTGGTYAFSGFAAYELSSNVSLGLGGSWLMGRVEKVENGSFVADDGSYTELRYSEVKNEISGGKQLAGGILVKLPPHWKFGTTVKSAATVDIETTQYWRWEETPGGVTESRPPMGPAQQDYPLNVLSGIAYRPNDSLTLACDYHFFQWSETEQRTETALGNTVVLKECNDTHQVHLGAEYLWSRFSRPVPLRLGFYSYPEPFHTEMQSQLMTLDPTIALIGQADEQVTRYFYTAGIGVVMPDLVADLALEFSPLTEEVQAVGATLKNTHTILKVYLSAIYKFDLFGLGG